MVGLSVISSIGFSLGAIGGVFIIKQGKNIEAILGKYYKIIIFGVFFLIFSLFCLIFALFILDFLELDHLIPVLLPQNLMLYFGAYFDEMMLFFGFIILGVLIIINLWGHKTRREIIKLSAGITATVIALVLLMSKMLPVEGLIRQPAVVKGVVLQTTLYTCAPASIATLARFVGIQPHLTELEVAKIAKTQISGTSTLAEINTMDKLGLQPEYKTRLTIDNLVNIAQPALLHVKEKQAEQEFRFSHAVALLKIEPERKILIIGNPLYGLEIKKFSQMQDYWFGEAIFVNTPVKL